jgi:hypothetical protein
MLEVRTNSWVERESISRKGRLVTIATEGKEPGAVFHVGIGK